MATDTIAQQTKIYKDITLNKLKYVIMTGDSIAYRFSLESNLSNYDYRKSINQYLFTQSISGSNLANFTGGDSSTWNPLSVVTRSTLGATNIFDITNCDLLIVWAGYNDRGDNIPLGATNSVDPLTYAGAINLTVSNYASRKPGMKIMFVTPNANPYAEVNNGIGLKLSDYIAHCKAVCSANGYYCFDLAAVCGITDANKATVLPDEIHPIQSWLEMWAPLFTSFIANNITFT